MSEHDSPGQNVPEIPVSPAQQSFFETLQDVQGRLDSAGVEYRVLGSIGTAALLQGTAFDGAIPLNFDRPGAYTPDQKVPDIDLLLPRGDIKFGQELRERYLGQILPVKMGVAMGIMIYDFRPDQPTSYLRYGKVEHAFDSAVFEPKIAKLGDVDVKTLSADALLHTFVTSGSLLRKKDVPAARALAALATEKGAEHDAKFGPFHDFISDRNRLYPAVRRRSVVHEAVKRHAPPRAYNIAMTSALKIASKLGRR